jgi:hypothetical protein
LSLLEVVVVEDRFEIQRTDSDLQRSAPPDVQVWPQRQQQVSELLLVKMILKRIGDMESPQVRETTDAHAYKVLEMF